MVSDEITLVHTVLITCGVNQSRETKSWKLREAAISVFRFGKAGLATVTYFVAVLTERLLSVHLILW